MKIEPLGIDGAFLCTSEIFTDSRGYVFEWFQNRELLKFTNRRFSVSQANLSMSTQGTIRGIHFSLIEGGQSKWVHCVSGSIRDVIVDIRPNSPTYKKWISVDLVGGEGKSIFIEGNLGHGFLALENHSFVSYLLNTKYSPENEYAINPLDPALNINWFLGTKIKIPIISDKDQRAYGIEKMSKLNLLPRLV